jgi:hypothetical protein
MWQNRIVRLSGLVFGICVSATGIARAESNEAVDNGANTRSPSASELQRRIVRNQKRYDALDVEIGILSSIQHKLEDSLAKIEKVTFNASAAQAFLEALKTASAGGQRKGSTDYSELKRWALELRIENVRFKPTFSTKERDSPVFQDIVSKLRDDDSSPEPAHAVSGVFDRIDDLDEVTGKAKLEETLTEARKAFSNMASLQDFFNASKKTLQTLYSGALERTKAEKKTRKDEQERLAKDTTEADNELEQLNKKNRERDSNLTTAIYLMIAVLVVLFLIMRTFSPEVQAQIIERRTLVEIIGMAFILLTIIILATGEKIERSVVGTLLGTIGGYIFGQQMRNDRIRKEDSPNKEVGQSKATEPTPAPLPTVPSAGAPPTEVSPS